MVEIKRMAFSRIFGSIRNTGSLYKALPSLSLRSVKVSFSVFYACVKS